MAYPNTPGINYVQDPGLNSGPKPFGAGWDQNQFMQGVVDKMDPSNPLRDRLIAFYGLSPTPAAGVNLSGAVYTQPSGTPGQADYTVTHGEIGAPRPIPQDENDPFYLPNYGVTDEVTPWLIEPQTHLLGQFRMGETGNPQKYLYGIPATSPIALPSNTAAAGQKVTPPIGQVQPLPPNPLAAAPGYNYSEGYGNK